VAGGAGDETNCANPAFRKSRDGPDCVRRRRPDDRGAWARRRDGQDATIIGDTTTGVAVRECAPGRTFVSERDVRRKRTNL
jgi:hypothetical protein